MCFKNAKRAVFLDRTCSIQIQFQKSFILAVKLCYQWKHPYCLIKFLTFDLRPTYTLRGFNVGALIVQKQLY